jgi:hypothetical protein
MRSSFTPSSPGIRRNQTSVLVAAATALATIAILPARPAIASEFFSESVAVPPPAVFNSTAVGGWKGFAILMQAADPLPAQDATDTFTDPFAVNGTSTITDNAYLFDPTTVGQWVGPGPITIAGLQRLHFTGTTPITAAAIPDQKIGNPPGEVQFGVRGPIDNSVMHIIGQHWTASAVGPFASSLPYLRGEPLVSVTPHPAPPATPPAGTSFKYIVDFLQFTQNGINGTEWVEFPYVPGQQPTFTYDGWADSIDRIHFTNVETQLSDTLIPLDDLNYLNDPPTKTSGPGAFVAQDLPADVVPEPSALMLLGAGLVAALRRTRSACTRVRET